MCTTAAHSIRSTQKFKKCDALCCAALVGHPALLSAGLLPNARAAASTAAVPSTDLAPNSEQQTMSGICLG